MIRATLDDHVAGAESRLAAVVERQDDIADEDDARSRSSPSGASANASAARDRRCG
jgi:hypothetical protein